VRILPIATPRPIFALVAADSLTLSVSVRSGRRSASTGTLKVFFVCPGRKRSLAYRFA
jgi:hypothetical protein